MWEVKIRKLDNVIPHPNADRLEIAYIGGWQIIVPKGKFRVGDLVVYFPADTIIPDHWLESFGLLGKLAGSQKNRVKPIRLRGELSIGIVEFPPPGYNEGDNVESYYGVYRYEQPIPPCLSGKILNRPRTFIKYDIDNINDPDLLKEFQNLDCDVVVTSKIHGTNVAFGLVDGEFHVCSRNYSLAENDGVYWRIARKYSIEQFLRDTYIVFKNESIWIHGEIFGNVQDLKYGLNSDIDFRLFDIRFDNEWIPFLMSKGENRVIPTKIKLPVVPILYEGPFDLDKIKSLAQSKERISGRELHIEEGVVIKPVIEKTYGLNCQRLIAKYINPQYLLRDDSNATEYH